MQEERETLCRTELKDWGEVFSSAQIILRFGVSVLECTFKAALAQVLEKVPERNLLFVTHSLCMVCLLLPMLPGEPGLV